MRKSRTPSRSAGNCELGLGYGSEVLLIFLTLDHRGNGLGTANSTVTTVPEIVFVQFSRLIVGQRATKHRSIELIYPVDQGCL